MSPADPLVEISAAVEGLLYPSESEYPLTAVRLTCGEFERLARSRPLSETTVEEFFGELKASDDGPRWEALQGTLEMRLTELRVFRIGSRRVDVYVVGKARGGKEWLGIKTVSVET